MADRLLHCSFCGKHQYEVRKLIAGPEVFICDECVALCNQIIDCAGERYMMAADIGLRQRMVLEVAA